MTAIPIKKSAGWPVYRIFGITFASDFPFANRLTKGTAPPTLSFTCVRQPPIPLDWQQTAPAYASPYRTGEGKSTVSLHRLADLDVLRFAGSADFYLWPDRILCHLLDPAFYYLVEIYLLGAVLSFRLESQGVPAMHASTVSIADRGAAFLSGNKGGKSALAAALMQAGHPLLTDDILPVEPLENTFMGRPGYANMRMWPEQARHFLDGYQDLEIIHPGLSKRRVPVGSGGFGNFCDKARPLACLYLPQRRSTGNADGAAPIEITPLSPVEAVIELVRHSFAAPIVEAIGWQRSRLDLFAQMVRRVPVRRLIYPSGFQYLPRVREAILNDLSV